MNNIHDAMIKNEFAYDRKAAYIKMKNGLIIYDNHTKHWYKDDLLHREEGPAVEDIAENYRAWYWEGKRHRIGGPAITYNNVDMEWYENGLLHREDGPAIEYPDVKEWWIKGNQHRLDGPAMEFVDGPKYWYYHGKQINCNSQQEFEKIIKLRLFW